MLYQTLPLRNRDVTMCGSPGSPCLGSNGRADAKYHIPTVLVLHVGNQVPKRTQFHSQFPQPKTPCSSSRVLSLYRTIGQQVAVPPVADQRWSKHSHCLVFCGGLPAVKPERSQVHPPDPSPNRRASVVVCTCTCVCGSGDGS